MSIEIDSVLTEDEKKRFNPSAIEWHAESRTIFLVSARNRQVLHLSETGDVLSKHRLKKSAHPQSEGLTIMPNGDWIIADEKAGKKYGRLTRYPSVP